MSDEQWVEYALLSCSDGEWLDIVTEIEDSAPLSADAPVSTGNSEIDDLDRRMYEKYVAKREAEKKGR